MISIAIATAMFAVVGFNIDGAMKMPAFIAGILLAPIGGIGLVIGLFVRFMRSTS